MIGIFDSGSGGLTVLKALEKHLPSVDVAYFGDIKNAPYGERSREELTQLTLAAVRFLHGKGATSIISACNSVSASLALSVFEVLPYAPERLIEMVGPTVGALRDVSEPILVLATPATVRSEIYQNGFRMIGKEVDAIAIPELAGAIERGEDASVCERIVRAVLEGVDASRYEVVVLACTHYPLVPQVWNALFPRARIFDPADAVAVRAGSAWSAQEAGAGEPTFYISKDSHAFRARVLALFPERAYEVVVLE